MRILILTASTGGGHKRAAAALKETIEKEDPSAVVNVTDGIQYCGKIYNKLICQGYYILATKIPNFYGKIYNISDKETKLNALCNTVNYREGRKLCSLFKAFHPDVVISCHPFIATMLSKLKMEGTIHVPVISIITDFALHRTYIMPGIDAYIASCDQMVDEIKQFKSARNSLVYPYGIPIFDKFYKVTDKRKTAQSLGFDPHLPTVLLMAGSFGVASVMDFYKAIVHTNLHCQCIVITGRNQKLYNAFEKYLADPHMPQKPTKLFYFIDNVEEYMHFSDLIVTKPGGLTVTESLACRLPLAIYCAFPGQEKQNADFLEQNHVAVSLSTNPKTGAKQISDLLAQPEKLKEMRGACQKIGKQNSALQIFKLAQELGRKGQKKEL